MAGGFLSEKWLGRPHPEIDHLENHSLVKYLLVIDDTLGSEGYQELLGRLAAMKAGTGLSIAALATLYVLGLPHVAAAIVGTRSSRHIADTMSLIGRELDAFVGGFAQIEGNCFDAERELGDPSTATSWA
ncbi:aldo/keto reductase [Sutterella sp.]|uniref:aldo/keto reductase n=1 Tax=Sutterella sp. TaxID=1981025 RepID=UPI003FD740D5